MWEDALLSKWSFARFLFTSIYLAAASCAPGEVASGRGADPQAIIRQRQTGTDNRGSVASLEDRAGGRVSSYTTSL